MSTARNVAIIMLLALAVAVLPGGEEGANAVLAALSLAFLAALGFAAYQLYRQNRLSYVALTDRQRASFLAALGAIVLIIAGADELLDSGLGFLVWVGVLALSILAISRVWTESRSL